MKARGGKQIVPPHSKAKPYGGKEDKETKEQKTEKKMPARSPNTFRADMRKLKKEYKV